MGWTYPKPSHFTRWNIYSLGKSIFPCLTSPYLSSTGALLITNLKLPGAGKSLKKQERKSKTCSYYHDSNVFNTRVLNTCLYTKMASLSLSEMKISKVKTTKHLYQKKNWKTSPSTEMGDNDGLRKIISERHYPVMMYKD